MRKSYLEMTPAEIEQALAEGWEPTNQEVVDRFALMLQRFGFETKIEEQPDGRFRVSYFNADGTEGGKSFLIGDVS